MTVQGHDIIFKEGSAGVFIQNPRSLFVEGRKGIIKEDLVYYYDLEHVLNGFEFKILFMMSALNLDEPEYNTEYWRRLQNKRNGSIEEMRKKVRDVKEQYFDHYDNTRRYSEDLQTPNV